MTVLAACTSVTSFLDRAIPDAHADTVVTELAPKDVVATELAPKFATAPPPPVPKPYQLPTFEGHAAQVNDRIKPLTHAPKLDADAIFTSVINCYPQKSKWRLEVELRGVIRDESSFDFNQNEISQNYAEIVASMPLYSAAELDRATKNEYDLRQQTASTVAQFISAIAERNHSIRKLALYESLEARAGVRVRAGVAGAEEQVAYLEKVAASNEARIKAESAITTARIALASICNQREFKRMNSYLQQIAALN